jgi:DNA primase
MALPPSFLDELRSRVSLADIAGRKVTWDRRKSNHAKGDWWAPCPFHQEKTASFHVDEPKGFYYCFGCQAKGDAITFLREADNLSFMEAVEECARMAGMEMPAPDPKAAAQARARATLTEVMEQAVQHYRMQLASAAGADARAELARRGLDGDAIARFELGFAPPGWEGLRTALTAKGVESDQLLETGLVRPSDRGRAPYDTFRNRIMFPIRDARGRAIAFGARAMDPGDGAKYLNSPDTALFDKSRTLYNHGPARAACAKGAALVVAEGYMDVIALARAGLEGAVAPLGTAITAAQLEAMWQIHPEPVIALDGDAAGQRAAGRLIDLAAPLIGAGRALRFALLPAGQDPDDLIRAEGGGAMAALVEGARPMVDLMWQRLVEGRVLDSPERRAALDRDLRAAVDRIEDRALRAHYGREIAERRARLFGYDRPGAGAVPARRRSPPGAGPTARFRPAGPPMPAPQALDVTRAAAQAAAGTPPEHLREALILATLARVPRLIEEFAHLLEETDFSGPGHAELAVALLTCDVLATPEQVAADLAARLGRAPLESLPAPRHLSLSPALRRGGEIEAARICLTWEFGRLEADRGARREVAEAMAALGAGPRGAVRAELAEDAAPYAGRTTEAEDDRAQPGATEATEAGAGWPDTEEDDDAPDPITWRLAEAARARLAAERAQDGDRAEFDIAENGARLDRAERAAFRDLLGRVQAARPSRRRRGPG